MLAAYLRTFLHALSVRLMAHNGLEQVLVYVQAGQFLLNFLCKNIGILTA